MMEMNEIISVFSKHLKNLRSETDYPARDYCCLIVLSSNNIWVLHGKFNRYQSFASYKHEMKTGTNGEDANCRAMNHSWWIGIGIAYEYTSQFKCFPENIPPAARLDWLTRQLRLQTVQ